MERKTNKETKTKIKTKTSTAMRSNKKWPLAT